MMDCGPNVDFEHCSGCKACYNFCPSDVFGWEDERRVPTVLHPAECHYCGACEIECLEMAINLKLPLHARIEYGLG